MNAIETVPIGATGLRTTRLAFGSAPASTLDRVRHALLGGLVDEQVPGDHPRSVRPARPEQADGVGLVHEQQGVAPAICDLTITPQGLTLPQAISLAP